MCIGVYRYGASDSNGNCAKYDGMYKNDEENGFGRLTNRDGSYREGQFVNGKEEGKFKVVNEKGKVHSFTYKNGRMWHR